MSKFLSALFAFALFGSPNITPRQLELGQDPLEQAGLVVIAMHNDPGLEMLSLAKINPATCYVEKTVGLEYDPTLSGDTFVHEAVEPGVWVVAETTFREDKKRTVVRYENGTFAFEVTPDQATYVGKLTLSKNTSKIDRPDREALNQYIIDKADIPMNTNIAVPWITPYSADASVERAPVANCNSGPLAFLDENAA